MLAVPPLSAAARAHAAHRAADPDNFAFWHMPVGGVDEVLQHDMVAFRKSLK